MDKKRRERMNVNRTASKAVKRLSDLVEVFDPHSLDDACKTRFFVDLQTVLGLRLPAQQAAGLGSLVQAATMQWAAVVASLLSDEAESRGLGRLDELQFPPKILTEGEKRFVEIMLNLKHENRNAALYFLVESDDFSASLTVWYEKREDDPDDTPDAYVEVVAPSTIYRRLIEPMFTYLCNDTLPA